MVTMKKAKLFTILALILLPIIEFSIFCSTEYAFTKSVKVQETLTRDTVFYKYKWMTPEIYGSIRKNLEDYPLSYQEKNYFTILTAAIIDKESHGRKGAVGVKCKVWLLRDGKYVREVHRARGLMQVMIFNTDLKPQEAWKLHTVDTNIKYGIAVLMKSYKHADGNLIIALKNYNSGINSERYNWKYINHIVGDVDELSI